MTTTTKKRPGPRRTPVLVRALSRIVPGEEDETLGSAHWEYRGAAVRGLPVIGDGKITRSVARVLFEGLVAKLAPEERLQSTCGRTSCCNPSHRRTAAAALVWLLLALAAPAYATPPTIVLIVVDDMAVSDLAVTPSIRAIGERGASFDAALTPFPLCSPSRTSLLTGLSPTHHRVYANDAAEFDPTWETLGTRLQAAGYRTAIIGKVLNRITHLAVDRLPGWDTYFALQKHGDFGRNQTTVLANRGADFIRQAQRDGVPAFLYLAPAAPHGPNRGPSPECDAPPSTPLPEGADPTLWFRRMSSLCGVDRLVEKLDRLAGQNAVTIVISDNGWMSSNGRTGKMETVLDAVRVPLVMRGPGIEPGRTRNEISTLMDVSATVLALAGLSPALPSDGRSLVPLLGPDANVDPAPWNPTILIESVAPDGDER